MSLTRLFHNAVKFYSHLFIPFPEVESQLALEEELEHIASKNLTSSIYNLCLLYRGRKV